MPKTLREVVDCLTELGEQYPYMWGAPLRVQDESGIIDRMVSTVDTAGDAYLILEDES